MATLERLLKQGKIVYVHCIAGVNRSPTVVAAYLHWCVELELVQILLIRMHVVIACQMRSLFTSQEYTSREDLRMHILHVVGARPNLMKVAPVLRALKQVSKIKQSLIHTGQHYDANMSDVFFQQLEIPVPDVNLEVGSGSHALQTADIMTRLEPIILERRPDLVLTGPMSWPESIPINSRRTARNISIARPFRTLLPGNLGTWAGTC